MAASYYLASRLSLNFAVLPGLISPLWPPAAIAVYACLAWGPAFAAAIWMAAFASYLSSGLPLPLAVFVGSGAPLEALAISFLISRIYRARTEFIYCGPVFRFVGITLLSCALSASIGIGGMAMIEPMTARDAALSWVIWWMGNATGVIVGVPLLIAWNVAQGIEWRSSRMLEAGAFAVLLPVVTYVTLSDLPGGFPAAYLSLPFLLWAAFRFNFATVNWATAIICVIAVWNTSHDFGPFIDGNRNASLLFLMIYLGVIGTTGLTLASLAFQRAAAEKKLRAERDHLEQRVKERTEALSRDIEARKRVELQLADAQRLAQIGSWNWDLASGTITWSDELYRIYGVSKDEFQPTIERCRKLIDEADHAPLAKCVAATCASGEAFRIEHQLRRHDGSIRIVSARGQSVRNSSGRVTRLFGTVQDVTETRRAEASLREAEERYRKLVELSPDAILVQQEGNLVFVNPAALALLGAQCEDQIVGRRLFDFIHPEFHELARKRIQCLQRNEVLPAVEKTLVRLDGSTVDVEVKSSAFLHKGGFASLYIMRDITERKKSQERMAYLAHYDSLTGLPNRALFHQRLQHALTISERPGRSLEVLFLDLDRFKNINDTLGHQVGDMVLKETAHRLQSILRESDTVARLGGDEFVVLVENVDEPHRGGFIAEKILAAFVPPFMRDDCPLSISTSIGISSFPSDGTDAETLLKNADIAMYRAKEMGRNNYRYYSPEMNRHSTERLALEYALSHAIQNGQLSLYYQPKIDVLTNRITGMEALLRWRHPTLGAVAPQKFIPLAEETGLISSIGYWAIRTACLQNKYWQQTSTARLKVAVNLSPRQLADEKLVENIAEILRDAELDPCYLELEITEGAMMANPERAIALLNVLRNMGISVAIDDFGVGHSSLAYLKRFPVRAVKIDRSFVQGVPHSRGDSAIAKAIITLAHSLECSVIAEGAETQQQYDFLRDNDCDSVQGFYFSEPMPAEIFGDLIKAQAKLSVH